jgi:hypothetical protein
MHAGSYRHQDIRVTTFAKVPSVSEPHIREPKALLLLLLLLVSSSFFYQRCVSCRRQGLPDAHLQPVRPLPLPLMYCMLFYAGTKTSVPPPSPRSCQSVKHTSASPRPCCCWCLLPAAILYLRVSCRHRAGHDAPLQHICGSWQAIATVAR